MRTSSPSIPAGDWDMAGTSLRPATFSEVGVQVGQQFTKARSPDMDPAYARTRALLASLGYSVRSLQIPGLEPRTICHTNLHVGQLSVPIAAC